MERNSRTRNVRRNTTKREQYITGNLAYDYSVREPRTYVDNERVKTSSHVYKNREKAVSMSMAYVVLMAVCCIAMAATCAYYISYRNKVSSQKELIANTEMEIEKLRSQNDAVEYAINGAVDSEEIARVATEELGMQKAKIGQVVVYDQTESEYMKQYNDVPSK